MNPFKWFNDLIERSALWYAVYIIALRIICGNFFYSLSDQAFYAFAIIFFSIFDYMACKLILKKFENHMRHYEQCSFGLILFFIFVVPILIFYALIYHPLLGTFITMIFFFLGAVALKVIEHFQREKQA